MLICYDKAFPEAARTLDARRRRDALLPVAPGRAARPTPAPRPHRRPPVAPRRAVGPRPRGGELAHRRLREPDRHASAACDFLGGARIVNPGGDVVAADRPGARPRDHDARPRRRRSRRPAARCPRSATCAPTCTARPSRSRSSHAQRRLHPPLARRRRVQRCQSPSTADRAHLAEGGRYPRRRAAAPRRARPRRRERSASREVFGMACTAAPRRSRRSSRGARDRDGDRRRSTRMRRAATRVRFPAPTRLAGHHEVVDRRRRPGRASSVSHVPDASAASSTSCSSATASLHNWRDARWDAFCLVTPNWQCALPGHPYAGRRPRRLHGQGRDPRLRRALRDAASRSTRASTVHARPARASSSRRRHGALTADQVVLAVGGYHVPCVPRSHGAPGVTQLHSTATATPASLPDGAVLVVGTGQSGAQIAEDLHLAGREVHLARRHRAARRPLLPRPRLRRLAARHGPLRHADHRAPAGQGRAPGGQPLRDRPRRRARPRPARVRARGHAPARPARRDVDDGDAALRRRPAREPRRRRRDDGAHQGRASTATSRRTAIDAPDEPRYTPVWQPPADGSGTLDVERASARSSGRPASAATGPGCDAARGFDADGYPEHVRGVTTVDGLYVVGLPWLHTWGSGRFAGIARDAEHLAEAISASAALPSRPRRSPQRQAA